MARHGACTRALRRPIPDWRGGILPSALATLVWLLAAASPAEPGLAETQAAAARAAGGSAAEDDSRAERARISHWAPQLRAQGLVRDDEKSREGVYRLAPIQEQD